MRITKEVNKRIVNKIISISDDIKELSDRIEWKTGLGETPLAEALWSAKDKLDLISENLEQAIAKEQ